MLLLPTSYSGARQNSRGTHHATLRWRGLRCEESQMFRTQIVTEMKLKQNILCMCVVRKPHHNASVAVLR